MNKKGMTLVEIIVAISLISVVMIFLFQVLITVINGNKRNNTKSKTLISKAIVMKAVEHDLDMFGLQDINSVKECGDFDGISDSAKNQIIPIAASRNDYYCIKITYNPLNVKNSEGYLLFYQNNEKGFLAYKRGIYTYDEVGNNVGFIIESQVIREIDAVPKNDGLSKLIKKAEENDLYSLKINIPIIATDGNNYDLALNYIDGGTLNNLLPDSNPVNFAKDSWATIAAYVKANKESTASVYAVGSEKEVTIDGTDYTVRIANNSNYDCSLESKTACGFVVEFVDIVEQRAMNSGNTNVGGWPATAMRTYLNGGFLAKLPSDLQSEIADTTVVSGHGMNDSSNFTSTDKIYLLSTKEVWGSVKYDTLESTRQLDYYANNNVTISNYSGAKKNYAGSAAWWWLRAAVSNNNYGFLYVISSGDWSGNDAYNTSGGVAPAFRIA